MPWTFAHIAAVIPIAKNTRISLLGLAVGSIIPDLYYYLGAPGKAANFHSTTGIFLYCLPFGILLTLIIKLMQLRFLYLLPNNIHRLFVKDTEINKVNLSSTVNILAGIVIGAFTHIAWDSFTHETGLFVARFDIFRQFIFQIGGRDISVYNVLQHISSSFGVAYIITSALRFAKLNNSEPVSVKLKSDQIRIRFWYFMLVFSIFTTLVFTVATIDYAHVKNARSYFLVQCITNGTSIFTITIILASLLLYKRIDGR